MWGGETNWHRWVAIVIHNGGRREGRIGRVYVDVDADKVDVRQCRSQEECSYITTKASVEAQRRGRLEINLLDVGEKVRIDEEVFCRVGSRARCSQIQPPKSII